MKKRVAIAFLSLFLVERVQATHIKGGFISVVHERGTTVTIQVNIWTDSDSYISPGTGTLNYGDGESVSTALVTSARQLSNGHSIVTLEYQHTYPGVGTFTIGYQESFRNADVLNITNSVGTPFYTETTVTLDPAFPNSFPRVNPDVPLEAFYEVPYRAAFQVMDDEGDLITYHLVAPLKAPNTKVDYKFPDDASFQSEKPNQLQLDRYSGNLTWDAPPLLFAGNGHSEYSLALEVREWRLFLGAWFKISTTRLDFNVEVGEAPDAVGSILFPETLCDVTAPHTMEIVVEDRAVLSVDLPFLLLESGEPANSLDGQIISANQTFRFIPNADFTQSGFVLGHIALRSDSDLTEPWAVSYNVLYASDCDQLEAYQVITSTPPTSPEIQLFPNPISSEFRITGITSGQLTFYSLSGQEVFKIAVEGDQLIQLPADFQKGIYLVQVTENELLVLTTRVVVQ